MGAGVAQARVGALFGGDVAVVGVGMGSGDVGRRGAGGVGGGGHAAVDGGDGGVVVGAGGPTGIAEGGEGGLFGVGGGVGGIWREVVVGADGEAEEGDVGASGAEGGGGREGAAGVGGGVVGVAAEAVVAAVGGAAGGEEGGGETGRTHAKSVSWQPHTRQISSNMPSPPPRPLLFALPTSAPGHPPPLQYPVPSRLASPPHGPAHGPSHRPAHEAVAHDPHRRAKSIRGCFINIDYIIVSRNTPSMTPSKHPLSRCRRQESQRRPGHAARPAGATLRCETPFQPA